MSDGVVLPSEQYVIKARVYVRLHAADLHTNMDGVQPKVVAQAPPLICRA